MANTKYGPTTKLKITQVMYEVVSSILSYLLSWPHDLYFHGFLIFTMSDNVFYFYKYKNKWFQVGKPEVREYVFPHEWKVTKCGLSGENRLVYQSM